MISKHSLFRAVLFTAIAITQYTYFHETGLWPILSAGIALFYFEEWWRHQPGGRPKGSQFALLGVTVVVLLGGAGIWYYKTQVLSNQATCTAL